MVRRFRPAAIAAGLLFSSTLSCTTPQLPAPAHARPSGDTLFARASDRYLAGETRAARDLFGRAAWARTSSPRRADAWYWHGRCELSLGRLEEARRSFTSALSALDEALPGRAPLQRRRDLIARILVGLADVARMQSKNAESLSHLKRIEAEGLGALVDGGEFAYRKAAAYEALGEVELARMQYRRAARLLRTSPLLSEARRRAVRLARSKYLATAGVFTARSSAESVARELKDRGVDALVERFDAGRKYAVALGSYDRYEDARAAAARASAHGFPASVTPHRPARGVRSP